VTTVLFACTHNAGRSQMAAAWFGALADPAKARAETAGTSPDNDKHAVDADAMREVGLDLSAAKPKLLTEAAAAGADWLMTMGCDEACPVVPGVKREDWALDDPARLPVERVRAIRDDIKQRVEGFLDREGLRR